MKDDGKDTDRSKDELLEQVASLRQRVRELEIAETRRALAEQELRASEERYRALVELLPVAVIVNVEGRIVFVNTATSRLAGLLPEKVIGQDVFDFIHPDYHAIARERIRWVIEKDMDAPFIEEKFVGKGGRVVDGEIASIPFSYEGRRAMLSVILDVTEKKKALRELEESERNHRLMVESLQEGLGIVDENENFVAVNPAYCIITGYSRDEMLRMNLRDLIPGEDMQKILTETDKRRYGAVSAYEFRMRRKDGEIRHCQVSVTPWMDETGYRGAIGLVLDQTDRKLAQDALKVSEEKYRSLFEHANEAVFVAQDGRLRLVNPKTVEMLGRPLDDIIEKPFVDFIHADDRDMVLTRHRERTAGKSGLPDFYTFRIVDASGRTLWVEIRVVLIDWEGRPGTLNLIADISDRVAAEEALRESERKYRELVENANSIIMRMDPAGTITFFNEFAQTFFEFREEDILGRKIVGTIVPETETSGRDLKKLLSNICESPDRYQVNENENITRSGRIVFVAWTNKAIVDEHGKVTGILCVGNDITERKRAEDKLAYMSLHDPLTGVNNRTFFEQSLAITPVPAGVIVCDVDGLKLVNDTLGHDQGDRLLVAAARILKDCFRGEDVVSRIGGDEFAVLLHVTDPEVVEKIIRRVRTSIAKHSEANPQVPLSLSIGFAATSDSAKGLDDVFKEADNNMYRDKLQHGKSARSFFVKAILSALRLRKVMPDPENTRIQDLATRLGMAVGLPERAMGDLRLLAKFHDLGMVGVREELILKPGTLTPEEKTEIRAHCEIGMRIAQAVPELLPIADCILRHHEWWNGQGYPLGLKKGEIPVECRIVAIAEAYDAMTHDRPYRKAMTHAQAVDEIKRCAGTQFDPALVARFLEILPEPQNQGG
jgi:diguanylate cyclase (GGDEF)-like protein/PAS domain S-box-containing protein